MKTDEYARWFRASTPYINAHRGRTFVVLLSGEALLHGNLTNIVHDLALLNVLGVRLVIVHGARPQIDAALPDSSFHTHQGVKRRITDAEAMQTVAGVYGQVRAELEALFSTGLPSSPLHNTEIQLVTGNFVTAKPIGILDGVDHALAGQARRIRAGAMHRALDTGAIVLLSPIGYSPSGQVFNLAADELARQTAVALGADKLIAFDRQPYLLGADGKRLANLASGELRETLGRTVQAASPDGQASVEIAPVDETTRRTLLALLQAVTGGVASGQMVSYAEDGALLAELFTAEGVGTQIMDQDRRVVRRAEARDVADIVEIIRPLEEAGVLVKRSRDRLEREIDHFFVAEVDGVVAGCCALYPAEPAASAAAAASASAGVQAAAGAGVELACVAVHPAHRGGEPGIGQKLLTAAEHAAHEAGYDHLFVLTTQARDWFIENGFREARSAALPAPKQGLYNYRRNSKVLIKSLPGHQEPAVEDRKHG